MRYKSSISLLGIPLVHVAIGPAPGSTAVRGIAKGWIAIGDLAFGVLIGVGGIAVGGLSFGGVSVGAIAIAGLSLGIWSVGGLALGIVAVGGAALGLSAAMGGLAVAGEYAVGGMAIGSHANDEAAIAFFESGGYLALTETAARYRDWFIALVVGFAALAWMLQQKKDDAG